MSTHFIVPINVRLLRRDVPYKATQSIPSFKQLGLVCLFSMAGSTSYADMDYHFSGFASLGAGKLDRKDVAFVDYDNDWSVKTDSIIGAQAQVQFSNRWSAATQVVAKGFTFGEPSSFEPTLEWLFASYQLSPETRVRFGRLRTPLYLYSDSLEVGYSYPWVRPPVDTYAHVIEPLANVDGIDLTTIIDLGNADLDINFLLGKTKGSYQDMQLNFDFLIGGSFKLHWQDFTFRYGLTMTQLDAYVDSADMDLLLLTLNQTATNTGLPIFSQVADAFSTENGWFQYHGVGAQWDPGNLSLIAELYTTLGPNKGFANDAYGWDITAAYNIKQFTPYAVVGYYKNRFADEIENLTRATEQYVPPGVSAGLDELRATVLYIADEFNESGFSYTVGLRYDFHSQAAIKVEAQYFDSTALLRGENLKNIKQEATLMTVVVDVVF